MIHRLFKHLEFRQKYSAARRIFNTFLGVWLSEWNTVPRVWYITWATAALSLNKGVLFRSWDWEVQRTKPTRNPIFKRTWLGINKSLTEAESKSTAWKPATQTWVSTYKLSSLESLYFITRVTRIWLGLERGVDFAQMLLFQCLKKLHHGLGIVKSSLMSRNAG